MIVGGEPLLGQKVTKNISVYPKGVGGDKPAWVAFDRQVNGIVMYMYTVLCRPQSVNRWSKSMIIKLTSENVRALHEVASHWCIQLK